jgi:hypothetical protein
LVKDVGGDGGLNLCGLHHPILAVSAHVLVVLPS